VVRTRAFNHTGPREDTGFACSTFARQIAEAEAKPGDGVIRVGNLNAYRDISDVRDVVRGYVAAMEKGEAGRVYNVCSGKAVQIREVLETLVSLSETPLRVELDTSRLRPSDLPYQQGNAKLLKSDAGWRPKISLERTLRDLLDYWRARVGKNLA
jgi:GDP-4-dehydro-6-deoxy-D-mannose reductase